MHFDPAELDLLAAAMRQLDAGYHQLPSMAKPVAATNQFSAVLQQAASRMQDNDPYFHPLYCGQMLKPPHPIARLAYAMSMLINPNNHALDGGRASSTLERACVQDIANMFGWESPCLGHLCGGGTMANFEALWVARELRPGKSIAASTQAHYTHGRLANVLQVPFVPVPVDKAARMDLQALENLLRPGNIGTVVATLGTTALGAVDPLAEIVALRDKYHFRLHVDAAYGGYYKTVDNIALETQRHFAATRFADSIAIDPHKHGLQPYGCGCILFRDPEVARFYLHDSPYTYYTSEELHLGEISLECSRAGAAAVALWSTMQLLPLIKGGTFAAGLEAGRRAATGLYEWLLSQPMFVPLMPPELDIVVWGLRATSASVASAQARAFFEAARQHDVYLALATMPQQLVEPLGFITHWDQPQLTCLRATFMKPEHEPWLPEIIRRLELTCSGLP